MSDLLKLTIGIWIVILCGVLLLTGCSAVPFDVGGNARVGEPRSREAEAVALEAVAPSGRKPVEVDARLRQLCLLYPLKDQPRCILMLM